MTLYLLFIWEKLISFNDLIFIKGLRESLLSLDSFNIGIF